MSDPPFSPGMRRALDGFAPPPPATGFADRALERIQARDQAALPTLPRLSRRWRSASPWRRGGAIVGAIASLTLVSAAAAATGIFGQAIEVPVISPIARSLDMVPAPVLRRAPPAAALAPATAPGVSAAREQLDALIDDPEFRALPPVERRAELRRTARDLVASGEARPREVATALRETGRERLAAMTPEQREQVAAAVAERREERRQSLAGTTPAERRLMRREAVRERRAAALEPEAVQPESDLSDGPEQ